MHTSSQNQVLESVGIVNTARSVWQIYRDKQDKDLLYFAPSKTNDCIDPKTVSYRILPPHGRVEIIGTDIEKTADDFMHEAQQGAPRGRKPEKLECCITWLNEFIADGEGQTFDHGQGV